MPTIDTPHGTVHYRAAGPEASTAPPVVFVHGLLVNGELGTAVADALAAQGIRSYAPDLPLGAHPVALAPDADVSPRGVARLLDEFLAALELTDVTLVGNDTGGALCQFLIDESPQRIGRLVLTNCDAFDEFPPAPFGLLVAAGRKAWRLKLLMGPMRLRPLRHSALGFGPLATTRLDPELTRRWITPALTDAGVRRDAARFMAQIRKQDLLDVSTRLGGFVKPVLLVWGAADRFFKLSLAERLVHTFADARLVTVPDARTFVALDAPERLADEIASLVHSG
jgi:pimeloyl-ACP methyl ester carboxylesterase